jgi:hypothetical protein
MCGGPVLAHEKDAIVGKCVGITEGIIPENTVRRPYQAPFVLVFELHAFCCSNPNLAQLSPFLLEIMGHPAFA